MPSWVVVTIVVIFAVFILIKSRIPLSGRRPEEREARDRLKAIRKQIAKAKGDKRARSELWREAALIALEQLERPYRAALYARRADKLAPDDEENLSVVVRAFRRARRFRALERLLWRRMDQLEGNTQAQERVLHHIIALYNGPLRRPAQARVIEKLWNKE